MSDEEQQQATEQVEEQTEQEEQTTDDAPAEEQTEQTAEETQEAADDALAELIEFELAMYSYPDPNAFQSQPVFDAIRNQRPDQIATLAAETNWNIRDEDGSSYLHFAYKLRAETAMVKALLPYSDLSQRDENGDSVIDLALRNQESYGEAFMKTLEEYLGEMMLGGDTVRLESMVIGGMEVPRPSSAKRKDIRAACEDMDNLLDSLDGFESKISQIHSAVHSADLETVKTALEKKKLAKGRDVTGMIPLHKAVVFQHLELVQYLAENFPVLIDTTDHVGRTALHYAAVCENEQIYQILLENGASEDATDLKGKTPAEYKEDKTLIDLQVIQERVLEKTAEIRKTMRSRPNTAEREKNAATSKREEREVDSRQSHRSKSAVIPIYDPKRDPFLTEKAPPPKTPETSYVADNLGEPLTLALAEIVDKRPWDPIEFLAQWLRHYSKQSKYQEKMKAEQAKLEPKQPPVIEYFRVSYQQETTVPDSQFLVPEEQAASPPQSPHLWGPRRSIPSKTPSVEGGQPPSVERKTRSMEEENGPRVREEKARSPETVLSGANSRLSPDSAVEVVAGTGDEDAVDGRAESAKEEVHDEKEEDEKMEERRLKLEEMLRPMVEAQNVPLEQDETPEFVYDETENRFKERTEQSELSKEGDISKEAEDVEDTTKQAENESETTENNAEKPVRNFVSIPTDIMEENENDDEENEVKDAQQDQQELDAEKEAAVTEEERQNKCKEEVQEMEEAEERKRKEEEERIRLEELEAKRKQESSLAPPDLPTVAEESEAEPETARLQPKPGLRDQNGQTELHRAALTEESNLAELLESGFDLTMRDVNGKTAYQLADEAGLQGNKDIIDAHVLRIFESGNIAQMTVLLLNGYENLPDLDDKLDDLPEAVQAFWTGRAEMLESSSKARETIIQGDKEALVELLQNPVVAGRDLKGHSLLHEAVLNINKEGVELLLEKQACSVDDVDNYDRSALHYAAAIDGTMYTLLRASGADEALADIHGHMASYYIDNRTDIFSSVEGLEELVQVHIANLASEIIESADGIEQSIDKRVSQIEESELPETVDEEQDRAAAEEEVEAQEPEVEQEAEATEQAEQQDTQEGETQATEEAAQEVEEQEEEPTQEAE